MGGWSFACDFDFLDIQDYNRIIDDGMGDVQITIKANSCDVVLQQYELLKKQLVEYYPVVDGNFKFENIELSPYLKVGMMNGFVDRLPFIFWDSFWFLSSWGHAFYLLYCYMLNFF